MVLVVTPCLVMMIFCAKIFLNPTRITKSWVGHEQVLLKSVHKVSVQTVTLTFDLAAWFLFATHCLVMIIISVK